MISCNKENEIEYENILPFSPKALYLIILAGILAHLTFFGLPIRNWNSGVRSRKLLKAYSCGYSSGFTPDSHIKDNSSVQKNSTNLLAKVEIKMIEAIKLDAKKELKVFLKLKLMSVPFSIVPSSLLELRFHAI
jgi:hypothetical protein